MIAKKQKKKRLVLLDAHAILHRAYHALPDFSSSSGEPTGALYGLSAMLMKLVSDLSPDYMAACFDVSKPTYRHEAYKDYKAGRKKTDEELTKQIRRSKEVFEAFNIPIYEKAGYEADDVIGTIVEKTKNKKDVELIIASGDLDTLQLVSGKKVRVYTMRKGIKDTVVYDEEAVKERFGFDPELLPDYKGLRGDPSDNIPGVKGVGEKTATTLIKTYGDLESIYENLKKDQDKFIEKTGLTKRIANLLLENEEEAQFSKLLGEIKTDVSVKFELPDKEWREGLEIEKIISLFADLSFRTLSARAKEMFGNGEEEDDARTSEEEDVSEEDIQKTGLALWLLDSTISNPGTDDILNYAKEESFSDAQKKIFSDLKKADLEKVYKKIELPLVPVVERMEEAGVKIDKEFLKKLSKKYHKELEKLEKRIWKEAGEKFNINSPKQMSEVLYEKMGLGSGYIKKTSTGGKSTRESELEKLKPEHKIAGLVLEYRELQKLLSTYIDNLPDQVGKDGRLRANFLQTGTTTGRMSSQNPNLQNIPIKTERGREIRKAFVAKKGFALLDFDYSQIELRVSAMLSGDEKLIEIFKNGRDVHTEVAAQIFGVPPEKVDSEMRNQAKVINFGIHYGMGARALAQNLETDQKEAQKYLSEYFKKFSGLSDFAQKTKAEARQRGYTETYFGRKRFLPGLDSKLPYVRAEAERQALNAPIQGTQADIIKLAMIKVDDFLKKEKLLGKARLILQVHDELIYEVKKDLVDKVAPEIKFIMEEVLTPKETEGIKFEANGYTGPNWGELEKLAL